MSDSIPFGAAVEVGLGILTATAFVISLVFWMRNTPHRREIARALGPNGPAMPETLITWYGAAELTRFMDVAKGAMTDKGVSALELYRTPTLLWNDVWFAVSFAAFLVFGNLAIAHYMPLHAYGFGLAIFCAAMGGVYGAADVAEDLTLARIFSDNRPVMAFRASLLTHIKFAALFLAWPAIIGLAVKWAHHLAPAQFFGALKALPLLVVIAACFVPSLARILWACRVSLVSALAGYLLFLFVIQAQDLFADTTFGAQPLRQIAFWSGVFAAIAIVWALPVHYAARDALEGSWSAWYLPSVPPAAMVKWTPRLLGVVPVVSVMIGIFGAALETKGATHLDNGLELQYVLLATGAWITLGFVIAFMIVRRHLVDVLLNGPGSFGSRLFVIVSAAASTAAVGALLIWPFVTTQYILRAALIPFLFGSGVLLFGLISRLADRFRVPLIGLIIFGAAAATATNSHFNDVRTLLASSAQPQQISLGDAVKSWRIANHCAPSDDPTIEKASLKSCPPALIVAADGGASRSAYFTAKVMGRIFDDLSQPGHEKCSDDDNRARCIFAMSGVSGGSLGLAAVKAALLDADKGPPCKHSVSWQDCLPQLVAGDYLSPVFAGLGFRDHLAPGFSPFTDPEKWGDRAVLLEKSWEQNYLEQANGLAQQNCELSTPATGLCRPFAQPRPDGRWTPLLLLNGTSVQTGRRIIASELAPIWMASNPGKPSTPQALHQWAYDLFDILGASCEGEKSASSSCSSNAPADYRAPLNVRLSTAALLSARFPIISPAGGLPMGKGAGARGDEVVDGGYFENSGLTTALDVAAGLRSFGLTPIVLSISNDPTPEAATVPGPVSDQTNGVPPPRVVDPRTMHLSIGTALTSSFWIRAVDVIYAPLVALFKTRDGHAEEAGRVLTERLQEWDVPASVASNPASADDYATFFPIRVYARGEGFVMPEVSMSWWLSPVIRKALDLQLDHPANANQIKLLLGRLSHEGCPGCQAVEKAHE